ncbi:MAG: bifunctional nuclease family protein [Microthrixaceae bacterium]|nr:bifunctional nuclease family protein [Acidimicrobiales bacterium]MCB9404902.1 bifunctional nuclease family protein [Microthrixaceae bacterium]
MVEMEVVGVRVEMPSSSPIALLREVGGTQRVLPIFIGAPEATAIALALDDVVTPRPMTHDLMTNVIEELGANLDHVSVTDLRDGVFYAELHLATGVGPHTISSRPSDAIALAVRTGSPIYAAESVLDEAAYVEEDQADGPEAEAMVEEFKEFIDSVDPEDFAL